MKKNILSLAAVAMLGMASCSEDFEVAAPYKDVTVVYGIWDKDDTAHYVRIQKAFLDEKKSALDMSKVSDSSYYNNISVVVREISAAKQIIRTLPLEKIPDLAKEGYQKDPPANDQGFFQNPNNGYKVKTQLDSNKTYRLVITNNLTGNVDSSEIPIVGTIYTRTLMLGYEMFFARSSSKFALNIEKTANAKYYEVIIRFNYTDLNVVTNDSTKRHVDMTLGRILATGESLRLEVVNSQFYSFLAESIGPPPNSNIRRKMGYVDFLLYAGSNELYQYELVSNGQGGITNDQIRPVFTNIKGANTVGLMASRSHNFYLNYNIAAQTIDSLIKNPVTSPLNIIK